MKRKLDTRFPAARIKKIMQTDEDVGKLSLATPVLISRALELFLQDICNKTYDITIDKGAKTVSVAHLKACVAAFSEFDFLQDVVSSAAAVAGTAEGDEGGSNEPSTTRKERLPRVKEEPGSGGKEASALLSGAGELPGQSRRGRKRRANGSDPASVRRAVLKCDSVLAGQGAEAMAALDMHHARDTSDADDAVLDEDVDESKPLQRAGVTWPPHHPAQNIGNLNSGHPNGQKGATSAPSHVPHQPLGFDLNAEPESLPEDGDAGRALEDTGIVAPHLADQHSKLDSASPTVAKVELKEDAHPMDSLPSRIIVGLKPTKPMGRVVPAEEDDYDCVSEDEQHDGLAG